MNTVTLLAILAGLCVAWYVGATLKIYDVLKKKGHKVSFIWLRLMRPVYADRYRQMTKEETGHVGSLFYHWIISINLALVLVLAALLITL